MAYDGTNYSGFQLQPNRPTIQGELERALENVTTQAVRVIGAGRTDAGVHAQGQVISFEARWIHSVSDLERAMNAVLARDVSIRGLRAVSRQFHARFSAYRRLYVYRAYLSAVRVPCLDRFSYHAGARLDEPAMDSAAQGLLGEHDFAAWGQPPSGKNTVRRVFCVKWQRETGWAEPGVLASEVTQLQFAIEANAFLRGMVRRIVGGLVQVGKGRVSVGEFARIMDSRDISQAPAPAAAHGLVLWKVSYLSDAR